MTRLIFSILLLSFFAGPPARPAPPSPDEPDDDYLKIDRGAMKEFLEKKGHSLDKFGFDIDYLLTMPPECVAHYCHPSIENGKLQLFKDIQKNPITFPERMQEIARRCSKSLADLFHTADEVLGRKPKKVEMPKAEAVAGYPEKVGLAIGKIRAAIQTRDPATIATTVLAVKDDLKHTGVYKDDTLEIYFDGNQVHKFEKPERDIHILIDMEGDDTYEGCVAAADGGINMVFDFAGNDTYITKGDCAQAFATNGGYALLYDAAGDDKYICGNYGQACAMNGGVAALVDVSGNDTYEITSCGQAMAGPGSFAILIDYEGDDTYIGRDPMNGHPEVTVPAPQDEKHNANMVQGAAFGNRNNPMQAGGVAILLDCKGNDTYKAGCWAQGVGYFMGMGALIDLEGDDKYESWVYVMGSGAHGGAGLLVDVKGDDVYNVGGWNCLGMAVDFGIGMFLDGAGNDKYIGIASGCGRSIGLGIAIFQDSSGDDDYSQCKDGKLGFGQWYEREDYNNDGKITESERMHWGIFLDLGGMDKYPKDYRNCSRWDPGPYCGGLDRPSPPNALIERASLKDWENMEPAAVFAAIKKLATSNDDLKLLAEFGFAHGFAKDAGEALFKSGSKIEGSTYDSTLRLWIPEKDRAWAAKLGEYKARLEKAAVDELLAPKPIEGPEWVRKECREMAATLAASRREADFDRVKKWTATLKPLQDRRAALDEARSKDEKKLRQLWAARKQSPIKVDSALRDAAKELDKLDAKWRTDLPLASNLSEESLTLENFTLADSERATILRAREVEKANASAKGPIKSFVAELNAFRAMYGKGALESDAALSRCAEGDLKNGKPDPAKLPDRAKEAGFEGEVGETVPKGRDAAGAIEAADRAMILDAKWTHVGLSVSTQGGWWILLGKRK